MLKYILALIVTLCLTAPARSQVAVAVGGGWGGRRPPPRLVFFGRSAGRPGAGPERPHLPAGGDGLPQNTAPDLREHGGGVREAPVFPH